MVVPPLAPANTPGTTPSVYTIFDRTRQHAPERIAVERAGVAWSYGEIGDRADRLARRLRELGVGPDRPVGLCLERSPELVVGVLAILKAGGAYVPLDPAYPEHRLEYMLDQSRADVVVTQEGLRDRLPLKDRPVVCLDAGNGAAATESVEEAVAATANAGRDVQVAREPDVDEAGQDDPLAYVIYTSGSTGQPKAVAMPHGPLYRLIEWQVEQSPVRGGKTLQFAPISFDVSFQEMFSTFAECDTLVLISEETRRDPRRLLEEVERAGVERLFLPFVALQQLALVGVEDGIYPESLTEIVTAGEQLRISDEIRDWFRRLSDCSLHNHYGPSETHVVTAHSLAADPDAWPLLPPIGKPLPHVRIELLSEEQRPVDDGEAGELYVGGDCLARGYLHRPDLTDERFIRVPSGQNGSGRLYRTGDLARRLPNGALEFLGRTDDQLKVRGHRVEPGEVESALEAYPGVRSAVVVGHGEGSGEVRLAAYLVAEEGAGDGSTGEAGGESSTGETGVVPPVRGSDGQHATGPTTAELREYLGRRLPEYLVPALFVTLDEMPVTPSGKIDRRALPDPAAQRTAREGDYVAPEGETEAGLAEIWREELGFEQVGTEDNFFDLGGDSLHAISIYARIRDRFGVEIPFQSLFTRPTVAELAEEVEATMGGGTDSSPIPRVPRDERLPLSPAQEGLWFIQRLAPESTAYSTPYSFRVQGRLDVDVLERALDDLIRRHEILRTTFPESEGRPYQRVHDDIPWQLDRLDFTGLALDDREEALRREVDRQVERPFDLVEGPLVRAGVIRLGEDEHVFWLNLHHIITDGRSMAVFFEELSALYRSSSTGEPHELPEPPLQYGDYAVWKREELERRDELVDWWREALEGAPPLHGLPTDHPRPPSQSFRGARAAFAWDAGFSDSLRELSRDHNMTLPMLILAGLGALVRRYSEAEDLVLGVPTLGRDRVELERVQGFFVNTVPVRLDFSSPLTFGELLDQVRRVSLESLQYDALPFEQLVRELGIERQGSHNPLVQLAIAPQPPGERDLRLEGLAVEDAEVQRHTAIFDLTLFYSDGTDGLDGAVEYSTDLFEPDTIRRLLRHLRTLLASGLAEPAMPVDELPMLDEEERDRLADWNRAYADVDRERSYHELIEARARQSAEAVAAVDEEGETLTYAELDRRANQLAHYLIGTGLETGAVVAISLDRSLELLVGIFGILKAGGAYLPIDPSYPRERISLILEDARPTAVVTDSQVEERLPDTDVPVVRLDRDAERIGEEATEPTGRAVAPDQLAYLIYTSGSTGRPKGVMVEHRNIVNLVEVAREAFGIVPGDRILQFASPSFDVSVSDMGMTLSAGATLVLPPAGKVLLGIDLARYLRVHEVNVLPVPPAILPDMPTDIAEGVETVIVAGEACPADVVREWAPGRRFINAYGPTEATVYATFADCEPAPEAPPIGRPLGNYSAYVLDGAGNPVPVGVPGELHIGGAGVARGYLQRPDLTEERFVPDPFSGDEDARMYRTGDVVRWRADGQLDFLGRRDFQVQFRGYRIELGEIEEVLSSCEGVQNGAVTVHTEEDGDRRLVAYLVPDTGGEAKEDDGAGSDGSGPAAEATEAVGETVDHHLEGWRASYDQLYSDISGEHDEAAFFRGWISSFNGEPIPVEDMREWLRHTTDRILALRPRRVWEIGCGTGSILFTVAPECEEYFATDFSGVVIDRLREEVRRRGLPGVRLEQRPADDPEGVDNHRFDTIILNSVAQYFSGLPYLHRVTEGALAALAPGGTIFFGDIRSRPLLRAFHASVQLARSEEGEPAAEVARRVERAIQMEQELTVDPALFLEFPRRYPEVDHVELLLKRGRNDNELESYRYDAVAYLGGEEPVAPAASARWADIGRDLAEVERWLEAVDGDAAELLAVPNGRLTKPLAIVDALGSDRTVADIRAGIDARGPGGSHPEELVELGERLGYRVRLTWSRTGGPGEMDVLFERSADRTSVRPRPWRPGGRDSMHRAEEATGPAPTTVATGHPLTERVRSRLAERLPDYMVPSQYMILDELPLNTSGKVDRDALPTPEQEEIASDRDILPPRTDVERELAAMWCELLELEEVGVEESFFDLGGSSLMVARLDFQIESRLGVDLEMRALYEKQTIAEIAALIEGGAGETVSNLCFSPDLDLEEEARLDDAITADAPPAPPAEQGREILLTGATGFVGSRLLAELLGTGGARVHCLVRARDEKHARDRLRATYRKYGLDEALLDDRVLAVPGDLAEDRLGLDDPTFDRLASTIDVIYHNGAKVDHVRGYANLKPVNVDGTREILRLASHRRLKTVHFVSTLGVVDPAAFEADGVVPSGAPLGPVDRLPNGYMQSKCVAEAMVQRAIDRGIPGTIYRLGAVCGDSEIGVCDPDDFTHASLRTVIQLGVADDLNPDMTMVPVDFVARAVVALSRWDPAHGEVLHITHPEPGYWLDLLDALNQRGYPVRAIPFAELVETLREAAREGREVPILAFLPFIQQRWPGDDGYVAEDHFAHVRWDCARATEGLTELGVEPPPRPQAVLDRALDYLVGQGLIERASGAAE